MLVETPSPSPAAWHWGGVGVCPPAANCLISRAPEGATPSLCETLLNSVDALSADASHRALADACCIRSGHGLCAVYVLPPIGQCADRARRGDGRAQLSRRQRPLFVRHGGLDRLDAEHRRIIEATTRSGRANCARAGARGRGWNLAGGDGFARLCLSHL